MQIFHLPDLGEGLAEAEIRTWYVNVGDAVTIDQPMVSVETAKAVVDVPAPCSGKIAKLYASEGEVVATHAPLVAFYASEGEVLATHTPLVAAIVENAASAKTDKGTVVGNLEQSNVVLTENTITPPAASSTIIKAMPAVRALAKKLNVDLARLKPTGANGQVTAADVEAAASCMAISKKTVTVPAGVRVEPLRGVRRHMVNVMMQAHQYVVPVTLVDDGDVTNAPADLTVFVLQAMAAAAAEVPALNATYDHEQQQRYLHSDVNVGLAMDTDDGLFVPVLKNVAAQTAEQLRVSIDQFKQTVATRTVASPDLQGATISLSNFGMIAGRYANPIVVPPTVAILGCGKYRDEAVVYKGAIAIRRMLPLSLTVDHRVVTGAEASRFLAAVIQFLQSTRAPSNLNLRV